MKPYPIFLCDLTDRRCIVIGGDREAERKVTGLLEVDAPVTVIGDEVTDTLRELSDANRIDWITRGYRDGDLEGAFLVIVSERNPVRTGPIWDEANRVGALINAMDDVPHCNFVAGSVVRRGPLVVSISTSGAAPTVAVRLREEFEHRFSHGLGRYLEILGRLRDEMLQRHPDFEERRRIWYSLADSDLLELVESGRLEGVEGRIEELTGISLNRLETSAEETV